MRTLGNILFIMLLSQLAACASVAERAGQRLASQLEQAVLNQTDPELAKQGLPAYILLLDSRLVANPQDASALSSAARLYATYAGNFVDDASRANNLAMRSKEYATRALCLHSASLCPDTHSSTPDFSKALSEAVRKDVPYLYTYATSLVTWVQLNSDDWTAVAELPKAERALERVLAIDPDYESGRPHVYLGVMGMRLPAAMGGKPEQSRQHFEQALNIRQSLMTKALYARHYARVIYDQALHDKLVDSVLRAPIDANNESLLNQMAKAIANDLAASANDHF